MWGSIPKRSQNGIRFSIFDFRCFPQSVISRYGNNSLKLKATLNKNRQKQSTQYEKQSPDTTKAGRRNWLQAKQLKRKKLLLAILQLVSR